MSRVVWKIAQFASRAVVTTARIRPALHLAVASDVNVEDLDIPAKRRPPPVKERRRRDWLLFGSGSARLLPRLIAGRRDGAVFLSNLRPSRLASGADVSAAGSTG